MSEAKYKRSRTEKFLFNHPMCCFCGGNSVAATIDHVPSRQTFQSRRRPQGLEFPACRACNEFTRHHELVAALIARFYPDIKSAAEQDEMTKIAKAIRRYLPLLLNELQLTWIQQYDCERERANLPSGVTPLNVSGPQVNESIHLFAVKLCLALHYEHLKSIAPPTAGIAVRWYTNAEVDRIPDEVKSFFPSRQTLVQGTWNVEDEFSYAWSATEDKRVSAYMAVFRLSFMIVGFIHHDWATLPQIPNMAIYQPGFARRRK